MTARRDSTNNTKSREINHYPASGFLWSFNWRARARNSFFFAAENYDGQLCVLDGRWSARGFRGENKT